MRQENGTERFCAFALLCIEIHVKLKYEFCHIAETEGAFHPTYPKSVFVSGMGCWLLVNCLSRTLAFFPFKGTTGIGGSVFDHEEIPRCGPPKIAVHTPWCYPLVEVRPGSCMHCLGLPLRCIVCVLVALFCIDHTHSPHPPHLYHRQPQSSSSSSSSSSLWSLSSILSHIIHIVLIIPIIPVILIITVTWW